MPCLFPNPARVDNTTSYLVVVLMGSNGRWVKVCQIGQRSLWWLNMVTGQETVGYVHQVADLYDSIFIFLYHISKDTTTLS